MRAAGAPLRRERRYSMSPEHSPTTVRLYLPYPGTDAPVFCKVKPPDRAPVIAVVVLDTRADDCHITFPTEFADYL